MFRSRLFWKLFLGFTAVNLLSAAALIGLTASWQQQNARDRTLAELEAANNLFAELAPEWLANPTSDETSAAIERLSKESGIDIELIDPSRKRLVFAQTNRPANERENPRAQNTRVIEGEEGELLGTIRLTRHRHQPIGDLSTLIASYGGYALVAILLMVGVGYGVVTHLVGPVRSLNHAALAMAAGNYDQRAFVPNRDELGELAMSFNRMSQELGAQLDQLRESGRRQATVLGGMIEGVVAIDDRQRVLFANTAAGKLFGFLPPQVEGRPLLEAVRNRLLHEAASEAVATRRPQRFELEWQERNLSVQVTPLMGEPTSGAVVVLHDTTELRRLESLRRDFVANVSHERKTPLSAIKAYTETLLDGAEEDAEFRRRSLRRIDEQSERLSQLIADMLSLARIESAQQPFEIQKVRVSGVVDECLNDYQQRAEAKQIRLLPRPLKSMEEDHVQVRADPEGLRVILNNLIDNAIKYTPTGGEVGVGWRPDSGPERAMVRIDVVDSGIGIPGDKVARVFERFYRVDEARSDKAGGAGLGLSIVKHLAQSFGGSVSVESLPDAGTTFSVTLPSA